MPFVIGAAIVVVGGIFGVNQVKKIVDDPLVRAAGYVAIGYFGVKAFKMLKAG